MRSHYALARRGALVTCAALVLLLNASLPAAAQSVSEMVGKRYADSNAVVDQEVVNASRAVEEAAKGWATNGETTRGASGSIATLLVESDTLICAGWLISYERAMTNLATAGAFNTDSGTALVRELQRLKAQIERVCDQIISPIDDGGGGGGGGQGGDAVRSDCPECDAQRDDYQQAQWAFERAQFQYERAHANTNYLFDVWGSNPQAAARALLTPPLEAERIEKQKEEAMEGARTIMEIARAAWLACVERCHQALRNQYGFFDRNKKVLIAGLAVVTSVALIGGGGGQPIATPISTPVVTTVPPVATVPDITTPAPLPTPTPTPTPTPAPAPPSPAGEWRCGSCQRTVDISDHERVLRVCAQLNSSFSMTFDGTRLHITHPEPWVTLDGNFSAGSTSFLGSGMGSVGAFSGVSSRGQVVFQQTGNAIDSAQVMLTLGENGVFPGGQPVSYVITLVR